MRPLIPPDSQVVLEACPWSALRPGDIVCYRKEGWILHRYYGCEPGGRLIFKGDGRGWFDSPVEPEQVVGRLKKVLKGPLPWPLWQLLNGWIVVSTVCPLVILLRWGREGAPGGWARWNHRSGMAFSRVTGRLLLAWRTRAGGFHPRISDFPGGFRLSFASLQSGWIGICLNRAGVPAIVAYHLHEELPMRLLLEILKRRHFGWAEGQLLSPDPESGGPGWDRERDRDWLDFLIRQGFSVCQGGDGLYLRLLF